MAAVILSLLTVGLLLGCGTALDARAGHASPTAVSDETSDRPTGTAQPDTVVLQRGPIRARVWVGPSQTSRARYRGVRFETAGIVARVVTPNHTYFGPWKPHSPHGDGHDDVQGIADEFDLHRALGYEQAAPGEGFVKVGVGVLQRADDRPYIFHHDYPLLTPVDWRMRRQPDAITFSHSLHHDRWGYHYRKTIALHPDGLSISRALTNTGGRTIALDHYGHNFVRIDDAPPAAGGYHIRFPGPVALGSPDAAALAHTRPTSTGLTLLGHRGGSLRSDILPADPGADRLPLRVHHTRTGGWVEIDVEPTVSRLVLWATPSVLSPETFVALRVAPGATQRWTTRYRFAL